MTPQNFPTSSYSVQDAALRMLRRRQAHGAPSMEIIGKPCFNAPLPPLPPPKKKAHRCCSYPDQIRSARPFAQVPGRLVGSSSHPTRRNFDRSTLPSTQPYRQQLVPRNSDSRPAGGSCSVVRPTCRDLFFFLYSACGNWKLTFTV